MQIILASTSPYRKLLLERFPVTFDTVAPETDERPLPGETPELLVRRLALAKCRSVSKRFPDALVIGSDQVAECGGRIAGKPGTAERARQQLLSFSGRTVNFLSAYAIERRASGFLREGMVPTAVVFRDLSTDEIVRYLEQDTPLDCAGSFRSEAAGTALLERMSSDDPSAIMGLPLIEIAECLRTAGVPVP